MKLKTITTLAAGCLTASALTSVADPADGQAVFEARECVACHYTDGPAKETSIEDQMAKLGPELWYAGDKFQQEWMVAWLADPRPIRPLKYNSLTVDNPDDHPALSEGESETVAEFLMSLVSGEVEAGTVKVKKNAKGRQIFTKKMPCSGCHEYVGRRKVTTGGRSGPSLVGAGDRLNPDWVLAYLQNPETFKPVKMMPVFVGVLSDKDMANVAAHVATFSVK